MFGTDITLQKKAEEDLRVYSHIVATSTDFVSMIDRDYRYKAVNRSYLTALRKGRDEIVGHTIAEVLGKEFFETTVKPQLDRALDGQSTNFQAEIENLEFDKEEIRSDRAVKVSSKFMII